MIFEVTQNWSGSFVSYGMPWRGQIEFTVSAIGTGSYDDGDVLNAPGIYQRGEGHPANTTRLICLGPEIVARLGAGFYVVLCPFALDWQIITADDPLNDPPIITWTPAIATFPADHDLDNRVKANSAGEILSGGQRTVRYKQLKIVKNFPFFDLALSRDFEGTVNNAPVSLSGVITVATQHMYCTNIGPDISYPPDCTFLPIAFCWDVYPEGVLGDYPHQEKFLDAGENGWYTDSGTGNKNFGRFINTLLDPISDVRLDGTGLPLAKPNGPDVQVGSPTVGPSFSPVTPPSAVDAYAKEYYSNTGTKQTSPNSSTVSTFLFFKEARVVDYGPLLALF